MLSMRYTRRGGVAAIAAFSFICSFLYIFFDPRFAATTIPFSFKNGGSTTKASTISITPTVQVVHINGFTVFENIYLRNGTLFIVHPDSDSLGVSDRALGYAPREMLLSKPVDIKAGNGRLEHEATDEDLMFISNSSTKGFLGTSARRVSGVTVLLHDPVQFMGHYYHFWGEIILGAWRVYSTIAQGNMTHKSFPPTWSETEPMRFLIPAAKNGSWQDHAGLNYPLLRTGFPRASLEESNWWSDIQKPGTTVTFDRVLLVDRVTAHQHAYGRKWYKMISGTMALDAKKDFWEPIRKSVVKGFLGYVPTLNDKGVVLGAKDRGKDNMPPLVTYISRQRTGRRLTDKDHEGLVTALKGLETEGVIRFNLAMMERMSLREQIELVSKSTVIIGVHGNGLTHQLWMPSSPWSTVMEIFYPKSYVFDYEMLSRNAGHRHYAVWNDTFATYPEGTYHENFNYAEGFHSNNIPAFGPAIAAQIKERLSEQH